MAALLNDVNGEPVRLVTARATAFSGESSSAGADGVGDTGGCPSGCTCALPDCLFDFDTLAA